MPLLKALIVAVDSCGITPSLLASRILDGEHDLSDRIADVLRRLARRAEDVVQPSVALAHMDRRIHQRTVVRCAGRANKPLAQTLPAPIHPRKLFKNAQP